MRVIIIAGGSFAPCIEIYENDYVICADGGYDSAKKYKIQVNLVMGDMDSVTEDTNEIAEKIEFPVRKDYTDSELAVRKAISMNPEEIVLLGFTGTRLDHSVANIFLLKLIHESGIAAYIADSYNRVYYYKDMFEIKNFCGSTVSLIPLTAEISGITTKGLDYPLNNETLLFGQTRGISNVVVSDYAEYKSKSGEGLLIIVI